MPGVPKEMRELMKTGVMPLILKQYGQRSFPLRIVKTFGIPESEINEAFKTLRPQIPEGISIAWLPNYAEVKMELSLNDASVGEAELDAAQELIKNAFSDFVFTCDERNLQEVFGQLLKEKQKYLGLAESCTGGALASLITSVTGSAQYFKGGIVPYSEEIKTEVLKIPAELIEEKGIVSPEVATALAEEARRVFGADIGIGITGTAEVQPGDKDYAKPETWIAVADEKGVVCKKWVSLLDRNTNIRMIANAAMFWGIRVISGK